MHFTGIVEAREALLGVARMSTVVDPGLQLEEAMDAQGEGCAARPSRG